MVQYLTAPNSDLESLRLQLAALVQHQLCFMNHVLFPNCVYITSLEHNNEVEEENFYLIYEIKKDRGGMPQANIHFLQIPLRFRGQGLGSKVYRLLEEVLRNHGCVSVVLEARVNSLNPRDNSVGFWGKQGFVPGVHYAFDDENFPMIKMLRQT
ncbi:GCN5-related N-acetyltransferase [Desulfotomaculum nigrificans CO-1-SRB]|uniref:GCN5-related N-acetyltransferase n=1 Tax=Desulfotomaculum nigrificans (strain DSM 14880 / VKM B-2319 / CO-1-SRB) TaxID=868595 RepID=F6B4U0_DESCC|nr:GNAT family N-acetyltransferase [Desulfotomaculum nigrificans]AEF94202.1 GCN5-related N-acetyltransferase [Desulfotomaculum nigrificans CO-1-SRB]